MSRLDRFLRIVPTATWRMHPPSNWNEELREALSDNLVSVGWGGLLQLTDAGKKRVAEASADIADRTDANKNSVVR